MTASPLLWERYDASLLLFYLGALWEFIRAHDFEAATREEAIKRAPYLSNDHALKLSEGETPDQTSRRPPTDLMHRSGMRRRGHHFHVDSSAPV